MEVWVCSRREDFTFMKESPDWCDYYKDGKCSSGKPCDARKFVEERVCKWTQTPDGQYETACGNMFEFTFDGPKENSFTHCPFCGGKLEQ